MRKPEESVFPENIDPLIFYQDVNIERMSELGQYYIYLNENNFDAAKNYMASSDLDYYGAWLLNLIENRLYAIEDNMDELVGEKPNIVIHSEKEPHDYIGIDDENKFYNWTGDLSPYKIYLDMESYYRGPIDNIWDYARSGSTDTRSIDVIILNDEGNRIGLRELYEATHSSSGDDEGDYETVVDFWYTGHEQTFTTPKDGWYKFEVWGAQGGVNPQSGSYDPITEEYYNTSMSRDHNLGGYATGIMHLNKNTELYINVGGQPTGTNGGYNGGGSGDYIEYTYNGELDFDPELGYYVHHRVYMIGAGGGGASHIALSSGELSDFENDTDDILIAAGGGGGDTFIYHIGYDSSDSYSAKQQYSDGGAGGGFIGALGSKSYSYDTVQIPDSNGNNLTDAIYDSASGYYFTAWGGSQSWGGENRATSNADGDFGTGASGNKNYYSFAGGGGGLYGGGASYAANSSGGGSGWINTDDMYENKMVTFNYKYEYEMDDAIWCFAYNKSDDFEAETDPEDPTKYYYKNYNLEEGYTTKPTMYTISGQDAQYETDAEEYAYGNGHVRISISSVDPIPEHEPTDEELINMLKVSSTKESIATIEHSDDITVEAPRVMITGRFMGATDLSVKFGHRRSGPQRCEVTDADNIDKSFYLTNNDGKVFDATWSSYIPDDYNKIDIDEYTNTNLFILKDATTQLMCEPDSDFRYNILDYNGVEYRNSNPSSLDVSASGLMSALLNGESSVIIVPKADFVGTDNYESGEYNMQPINFKVLELEDLDLKTYINGLPWTSGDEVLYGIDNVIFVDSDAYIYLEIKSMCGENEYYLDTYTQRETGYYAGQAAFNFSSIQWNANSDIDLDCTPEPGQFCKIEFSVPYNETAFDGGSVIVSATLDDMNVAEEFIVAPYQTNAEIDNTSIHLNNIGDTMMLPITAYGIDEYGESRIIESPCFLPIYASVVSLDERIVNIARNGFVTALREGSTVVKLYYNSEDYITLTFTVGEE